MKNVVVIGGGTGQAALLKGLKRIKNINLSTIVTVADDGGSTGKLRDDFHLPAMGDIRNVLVALSKDETAMTKIMNYRFDENSNELANHSLGNILFSAIALANDSFIKGIEDLSKILNVQGNVYPSTLQYVTLSALMQDGSVIVGEHNITNAHKKIARIYYQDEVKAYYKTTEAIIEADYIIIGIGSLYTSILPNLIINDIKQALKETRAQIIYYCNSMSELGETDGLSLEDHVRIIEETIGKEIVDIVVCSNDSIPQQVIEAYLKEEAVPVTIKEETHHYKVVETSLLNFENNLVRHDANKVKQSFEKIMGTK